MEKVAHLSEQLINLKFLGLWLSEVITGCGCQAARALEPTNGINLQEYLAIKYLRQGILEKSFLAREVLELTGKSLLIQKPSQRIQPRL